MLIRLTTTVIALLLLRIATFSRERMVMTADGIAYTDLMTTRRRPLLSSVSDCHGRPGSELDLAVVERELFHLGRKERYE